MYIKLNQFTYQIAQALLFLRRRNIIHRDLKLENVLIDETEEGIVLKIGDFGWACQCINDKKNTLCGTPECIVL